MLPEQQQQRILGYFIEEAKDHLNTIEQGLLNLQATIVNPEMANEVFRAAHSVKGGAAMLGIESMQRTAHRMEDYFKLLKEAPVKVDRSLESMFLRVFDALQELLEQLQGPFGLTEDKAQSIMAGVEPVFQQLQEHLDQLVADADTDEVLEQVAPAAFKATAPQPVEESALKLVFSSDVSAALREMLARFKQADTDSSRSALEACCQMLERFGEQFNLPAWMNLVKHARWAVCDRNNDYRTLAPVLIKEIKKAQDLVLAGQEREIVLSQKLQTLAAQPYPIDAADSLDDLFADGATVTSTPEPSLNVGELKPSLSFEETEPSSSSDEGLSIDELLNEAANTPSGPEVGAAELTSLADLFEASGDDLDSDWQEEDVPLTEGTDPAEPLDIDVSTDFEDLLNDDPSDPGGNSSDFESGNELADLFEDGGSSDGIDIDALESLNFDDVGPSSEVPASLSESLNNSPLENTDSSLDDLFGATADGEAIGAAADDLFGDLPQAEDSADSPLDPYDSLEGLNDFAPSAPDEQSDEQSLDDLSLDLGDTVTALDFEALESSTPGAAAAPTDSFFEEPVAANSPNLESEPSEFDDFFTLETDSSPTDPVEEAPAEQDDLWATDSLNTGSSASLDSLSNDIWTDNGDEEGIDTDNSITVENPQKTAVDLEDGLVQTSQDLDLDDVWASVEAIDESVEAGNFPQEITTTSPQPSSDSEPLGMDLDDLFGSDGIDTAPNEVSLGGGVDSLGDDISLGLSSDVEPSQSEDLFFDGGLDSLLDGEIDFELSSEEPSQVDNQPFEAGLDDLFGSDETSGLEMPGESSPGEEPSLSDELDDLLGGDVSSLEPSLVEEESSQVDNLAPTEELGDLFGDGTSEAFLLEPDVTVDTAQVDGATTADSNDDLGALFGEGADATHDLFDDAAPVASAESDLESLNDILGDGPLGSLSDLGANLGEPADSSLSGSETVESGLTPDMLNVAPVNDLDFDLMDLEDGGIVTGFVTDEDILDTDGALTDEASADLLAGSNPTDGLSGLLENEDSSHDDSFDLSALGVGLPQEGDQDTTSQSDALGSSDDLSDFLESAVPSADGSDLESLDSLLSELPGDIRGDSPAEVSEADIFDENVAATAPEEPSAIDSDINFEEFDELEQLLPEPEAIVAPTAPVDEFGELEELLPAPVVSPPSDEAADEVEEDEFGDLEALLQEADKTLNTTGTGSASYRPTSNRLTSRRTVTNQTMRVSVGHLDNLSNLVGELVVNRNTLEQDQERLRQFLENLLFQVQQLNDVGQRMRDLYERSLLESSLISSRQSYQTGAVGASVESALTDHATGESFDALEMDRFTGFHTLSQEMIELIVRVRESASDIAYTVESSDQVTRQFRQVTNQLQEGLNKARMVPFAQAASRLPRAVRDISVKCGKEARLVVEGRDILIDKMILEQLYDPMTHLVNNAITHGVETPEERRVAGKSPEGVITVRAFYQGNQTVISVGDDGAGIDPDMVKQKALQKGLISQADVDTMTVLDVYDLLFHPGFSTRDQADDFAGRGFGMDVVRTSLADIRGNITIDSDLGRGTNFTIRLPLTLSISKALSCISNQARIAFPMDGVEDMFDVSRERIQPNDRGEDCILWRDTLLPFQNLSDLLSFNRTLGRGRVYGGNQDENMISIVVLRSASSFIALEVDQVMGEQEIVIKQLEGPVPKPTGIAGATVLGDGRVMPIADVLELIDLALGRVRREPNAAVWAQSDEAPPEDELSAVKSEPTVLIVDDSITVRELLSMSFNKVGYRVEQARDGQEAWEKLRSGLPCDLVFCDIEMPRMDGLELLSRLQKDGGLQQIPIAMLTSRGADRHRQMAVDLGASGYFTKPYLEEALLDAANKMLHGERLV